MARYYLVLKVMDLSESLSISGINVNKPEEEPFYFSPVFTSRDAALDWLGEDRDSVHVVEVETKSD